MECPPTVSRAACQTTGALWHRDLPDFCFRVRKNRKMLEKGDLFSCIRFARVFHSPLHFSTGAVVEMWEIPVFRTGFPITEKKTGCFQRPAYLADRFVDHAGDRWRPYKRILFLFRDQIFCPLFL